MGSGNKLFKNCQNHHYANYNLLYFCCIFLHSPTYRVCKCPKLRIICGSTHGQPCVRVPPVATIMAMMVSESPSTIRPISLTNHHNSHCWMPKHKPCAHTPSLFRKFLDTWWWCVWNIPQAMGWYKWHSLADVPVSTDFHVFTDTGTKRGAEDNSINTARSKKPRH